MGILLRYGLASEVGSYVRLIRGSTCKLTEDGCDGVLRSSQSIRGGILLSAVVLGGRWIPAIGRSTASMAIYDIAGVHYAGVSQVGTGVVSPLVVLLKRSARTNKCDIDNPIAMAKRRLVCEYVQENVQLQIPAYSPAATVYGTRGGKMPFISSDAWPRDIDRH